jgi:hypothetical protein
VLNVIASMLDESVSDLSIFQVTFLVVSNFSELQFHVGFDEYNLILNCKSSVMRPIKH